MNVKNANIVDMAFSPKPKPFRNHHTVTGQRWDYWRQMWT